MKNQITIRPSSIININDLNEFYWLKGELIAFCQKHKLSTHGAKSDLIKRIEVFLLTGSKTKYQPMKKTGNKDSLNQIKKQTLVLNYNNDAKTRAFFVTQVGRNFKFNSYLRQFANKTKIKPKMTYGGLVDGWILFEEERKNGKTKKTIPKQFEYNRFVKDYFFHEKNGTLKKAINAWKFIKSRNGPNTYAQFKKMASSLDN